MKLFLVAVAITSAVFAVKPNGRFSRGFQRLEAASPAPVPHTEYGPPPQPAEQPMTQYGPPPQEYGPPPQETTTAATAETTTGMPTTTEAQSEQVNPGNGTTNSTGRLTKGREQGVYYIYHPTGVLQKVAYSTKKDVRNMAYTTQIKYENVEPITAPIFTYDPKTLALTRYQP